VKRIRKLRFLLRRERRNRIKCPLFSSLSLRWLGETCIMRWKCNPWKFQRSLLQKCPAIAEESMFRRTTLVSLVQRSACHAKIQFPLLLHSTFPRIMIPLPLPYMAHFSFLWQQPSFLQKRKEIFG